MKFEVYKETESMPEKCKTVTLRLIGRDEGNVDVVAVDDNGEPLEQGYLICFCNDGRLLMRSNISKNLGFKLNEHRQIEIY